MISIPKPLPETQLDLLMKEVCELCGREQPAVKMMPFHWNRRCRDYNACYERRRKANR